MLKKSATDDRRFLKFPAVRACEFVSLPTLLASLISHSRAIIDYKSKPCPTQKRLAREFIRQIDILLIFFHEIRDSHLHFTTSLHLCLSELHFVLQNVQFLLQDFSKQGSRLYILMKSHFIADRSRILIRSVATALDIVQFDSLGISYEVKELVKLLNKQAQKGKINTDPNDQCVLRLVSQVLNQFENSFEPERGVVKRVLDYLGIWTWKECNEEVKFLEEEMSCYGEEEDRETSLLCSLIGFLCYCRGVVFDSEQIMNQSDARSAGVKVMLSCLNLEDFRCPISLELMMDPVTITTGQTYDRSFIEKWLKAGHLLCPKTGEKLRSTELVPNSALKNLIHQFCLDNGISMSKLGGRRRRVVSSPTPSPSSKQVMKFLAQFLAGRLTYGTDEQKNKAAFEIRLLAKANAHNRWVLIEVGNVPPLLDLLTSQESETQANAIAALLKLSKHPKGQKAIITEGGLMLLISVLRRGLKMESRQIAAATVFYLSTVDKYRKLIGSTREAVPALIELIRDGTLCGKKNALAAIFGLLMYHGNHKRVVDAGIVPLLVDLVASTERSDLLTDCLAVLASVAEKIDGSIAILQTSALPLVMGLLKSSVSRVGIRDYCLSILLSLCTNGGAEVVAILAKESALMPTLYSVITDGSSHSCKKAVTLINMLQKFQESSSSSLTAASSTGKDRIVQAL